LRQAKKTETQKQSVAFLVATCTFLVLGLMKTGKSKTERFGPIKKILFVYQLFGLCAHS
jgi:hypothetical protein